MKKRRLPFWIASGILLVILLSILIDKGRIIRIKAHLGDTEAMFLLGDAYTTTSGAGIVHGRSLDDYQNALFWLRKAASKGHLGAIYELGLITQDQERVMWFKKGAELGSKTCMVELSNGYLHQTYGLPKDIGAFLYWEARVSEVTMRENGRNQQEISQMLKAGEERRRREMHYDGPIRPLP